MNHTSKIGANIKHKKYNHLTPEQETKLLDEYRNDKSEKTLNKIINAYVRLVTKIARKRSFDRHELDDLIQVGLIGLITAVHKFDNTKGIQFSTLAYSYINWYILNYLYEESFIIKMPRSDHYKKIFFNIGKYLSVTDDLNECIEKMAIDLGVSRNDVQCVMNLYSGIVSIGSYEETDSDDADTDGYQIDLSDSSMSPETIYEENKMYLMSTDGIQLLLESLDVRSRDIIQSRYLNDETEPYRSIGGRYDISAQRTQQIEKTILSQMTNRAKRIYEEIYSSK